MNSDDPKLTAYALGELSGPEREVMEKLLKEDASLRAEAEETAAFARMLGETFHAEPAPLLAPGQRAEVLEEALHGRKTIPFFRRPWVARTLAAAATLAVLAAVGRFALPRPAAAPLAYAPAPAVTDEKADQPQSDARIAAAPVPANKQQFTGGAILASRGSLKENAAPATPNNPLDLDKLASTSATLDLTNAQAPTTDFFRNTQNGAPPDLTASKPSEPANRSNFAAKQPAAGSGPSATARARAALETRETAQVGLAGQNYGDGIAISTRNAQALAKQSQNEEALAAAEAPAPSLTAAPSAAAAPLSTVSTSGVIIEASKGQARTPADSMKNADASALLTQPTFTAQTLAAAVNHYVALGEEAAHQELATLAAKASNDRPLRDRIGILCQVLYTPREATALRAPRFGNTLVLGGAYTYTGTTSVASGILKAGSGEKALAAKRELSSKAKEAKDAKEAEAAEESAADYLAYCREHGVFRTVPIPLPKTSPESTEK